MAMVFFGLGAMGYPIAGRLAQKTPTYVWNRNQDIASNHAQKFQSIPLQEFSQLTDIQPQLLFFSLPSSQEVELLLEKILPHLVPSSPLNPTMVIDCTSGSSQKTIALAQRLKAKKIAMLDAPVSGGPIGADQGTLSAIVGGDAEDLERARLYLEMFASHIFHVGKIGSGHAVKAINNILNVSHLLVASEALCTLKNMGIDPGLALQAINKSSGRSLMTEERIPKEILTRKFSYGGKLGLIHKDVHQAYDMVQEYFPSSQMLKVVAELTSDALEHFGYDSDETELVRLVEQKAHAELVSR